MAEEMRTFDWLEPWWSTNKEDGRFHLNFERQLQTEVGPQHPLYGVRVQIVACGQGDDALFELRDGSGRFAVVHLTWKNSQEPMPWPVTEIYPSFHAFVVERMIPENNEFKNQ